MGKDRRDGSEWGGDPRAGISDTVLGYSAPGDPEANGERLVWIVLRENDQVGWKAALLLATLSST